MLKSKTFAHLCQAMKFATILVHMDFQCLAQMVKLSMIMEMEKKLFMERNIVPKHKNINY